MLEFVFVIFKKSMERRGQSKAVIKLEEDALTINVTPVAALDVPEMITVGKKTKAVRVKKAKLVRDCFTIPELEYPQLAALKQRCLAAGVAVKKSELLRAGLQALALMPETVLLG
ncbi:MAG: hypothetical protein RL571_1179 [Pseudomonadota bacterium]|jgi:hypothetical protein